MTVYIMDLDEKQGQRIPLSQASVDVLSERQRQISEEGWTPKHDDAHDFEQIAAAAACYAMPQECREYPTEMGGTVLDEMWPWDKKWWKPGDRRRDLVKAGALILAEIERLDRAEAQRGQVAIDEAKPEETSK